jgi:nucleoporin SEH1
VRIYEALEPTNLAQWSQMEEFEISSINSSDLKQGINQIQSQSQSQLQQQQPQLQQQQQSQLSQYGFQQQQQHQLQIQQQQQLQQQNYQLSQHPFQQPTHTNSTSSSGSSIVTTPGGVSDIPTMTSTTGAGTTSNVPTSTTATTTTATTAGFVQGVSPGSSTGIGGGQNSVVNNIHRPIDADSGYCIDWCPNRTSTPMMVVGLGKEIGARVSLLI